MEKQLLIICAIRLNFRQLGAFITSASTPLTEQKYTHPPLHEKIVKKGRINCPILRYAQCKPLSSVSH